MTKLRSSGLLLAVGLVLSSCSLFDSDDAPAVQSDRTTFGASSPAAQTPAETAVDAAPTQSQIFAELQDLYLLHGIEGSPVLDGDVWMLHGTAGDAVSLSQFLGAARRVQGVRNTRSFIVVATPAAAADDQMASPEDDAQAGDAATGAAEDSADPAAADPAADDPAASEPAAADPAAADDALARTGLSLNLALIASLLIVTGAVAISTGRHIWLRTQFTNCFRVVESTTTFTVNTKQSPWGGANHRRGRGPRRR